MPDQIAANPRWVAVLVGSAMLMQMLDGTIISTALPAIARSLHENPLKLNLAIASYLLSVAVFVPISGWLADRFGGQRVFTIAILVFAASSLLCGLSQTLTELVIARVLQGFGGALMVPVGRLVLLRMVPKRDLVRTLSHLSLTSLLGFALGPPVGGLVVTYGSWRWIFFINVPLGVIGAIFATLLIHDRLRDPRPLDIAGFVLTGIGLASLVFGFDNLGRGMLPAAMIIGLLCLGAVCLGLFGMHARRTRHPIIDLSLFEIPTFLTSVVGGGAFRLMNGANPFLLTMLFQLGFGLSPVVAGLFSLAHATGTLAMKFVSTPIIAAVGFRRLSIGTALLSAGFATSYGLFRPTTPHLLMTVVLLTGGFCSSLQFTSLGALAYADVPNSAMSRATSLASMGQQLSESVGVGLAALLVQCAILWRGDGPGITYQAVSPAFMIIAGLSLLSLLFFVRLAPTRVLPSATADRPRWRLRRRFRRGRQSGETDYPRRSARRA